MKLIFKNIKNYYFTIFAIVALYFQNFIIFFNHNFNGIGFPWDFYKSYYAYPAFFTTAISLGKFPQWIPFQSMGFPLVMVLQTGFHYPFFWIFPLLNLPFTFQSAIIFQELHIFFGCVGMFLFLRYVFNSSKYAILGAIAFQFFGGFFANSQHPDIVRAFAISPWIFYVFTLNLKKPTLSHRTLFIPIVIFVLATGSYPGNFISTLFIMSLFVIFQGISGYVKGIGKFKSIFTTGILFGLIFLGLSISMTHLGPIAQFGNELTRFDDPGSAIPRYKILVGGEFPGYFMSNTPIPAEISMQSTFLTLPIIIFASFFPVSLLKKYWVFLAIFVIAILMSLGNQTFFWPAVTDLIPTLELSRFVSSDYRIFIAIPLMIFAIAGLKSVIEKKFTLKSFSFRVVFVISWFSLGIFSLYANSGINTRWFNDYELLNQQIIFAVFILVATLCLLGYYTLKSNNNNRLYQKKPVAISLVALLFFSVLIVSDGSRVISDMVTWRDGGFEKIWKKHNIPLEKDGKLITFSVLENLPETRPEREIVGSKTPGASKGLLTGEYLTQDTGNAILVSRTIVESNEMYFNYMLKPWTPLLLEPPIVNYLGKISLPEEVFSNLDSLDEENSIRQTHYGINEIFYQVTLNEPKLMVENEMYFPGWTAILIYPDKELHVEAIEVNDVFRGWLLPAGDYEMKANFEFPNYFTFQIISISAFVVWILILIIFGRNLRNNILVK